MGPQENPSTHGAGRHLLTVHSLGGIDPSDRRPPSILGDWVPKSATIGTLCSWCSLDRGGSIGPHGFAPE